MDAVQHRDCGGKLESVEFDRIDDGNPPVVVTTRHIRCAKCGIVDPAPDARVPSGHVCLTDQDQVDLDDYYSDMDKVRGNE